MQILPYYLRLIRIPNLLFLAFIQFAMRQAVVSPILQEYGFDRLTLSVDLLLLIIATVFVAAGGYVLNDYFDIKIDAINRPNKQIIGKTISKKNAMLFYQIITAIGVLAGLLLAFRASSFTLGLIFVFVPGLLWFYSSNYKRQFLTGNLAVSFAAALSILTVAITEMAFLINQYGDLIFNTPIPRAIYGWLAGISLFAFMLTWIREIIKDMEDEAGDREMECRTMPIKWGAKKTKVFIYLLIGITIVALFAVDRLYIHFDGTLTFRYLLIGLVLPLLFLSYLIYRAKRRVDYHQASTFTKFIMLIGVLYSFVFYYLQAKTYGFPMFGLFTIMG